MEGGQDRTLAGAAERLGLVGRGLIVSYYLELKVTIHDTAVRVDSVNRLSGSNVDTKASSNASANVIAYKAVNQGGEVLPPEPPLSRGWCLSRFAQGDRRGGHHGRRTHTAWE
ncbi:MAG: hypothetical protein M3495_11685 [Pseudomonadota bacterium]|nr:hypothetical protein [Pseudomonadota bacterium]